MSVTQRKRHVDESGVEQEAWDLPSGRWERRDPSGGFSLTHCARGFPVSNVLPPADAGRLAGARSVDRLDYPPEFVFCPDSGKPLPTQPLHPVTSWVPPFDRSAGDHIQGLRVTAATLTVSRQPHQDETVDPDFTRALPSAGRYEFVSLLAPGGEAMLLAICTSQGSVSLWLPATAQWRTLEQLDDGILADSSVRPEHWRCEVTHDQDTARIFLPTHNGIACLEPDPLRLGYHLRYAGRGACVGAPMVWRDAVWSVVESDGGTLQLQSMTPTGHALGMLEIEGAPVGGAFSAPVSTRRNMIWPGDRGQITLEVRADGDVAAAYRPWPAQVSPRFAFGAPFQTTQGELWQACWSEAEPAHVHVRIDGRREEINIASAPRASTGRTNYRLAIRQKQAPWIDPEHGSDAETSAVFFPLVESATDTAVVGLRMEGPHGLEALLASPERVRAVLEVHSDQHPDMGLLVVSVSAPWAGRVFVHGRVLWFYHPELTQIVGWDLAA